MFQPLRVLPVLIVLASLFLVAKSVGLGIAIEAALTEDPEQLAFAPPLETAAGADGGAAAMLRLPPTPEALIEASAGDAQSDAMAEDEAGTSPESMTAPEAASDGEADAAIDAMASDSPDGDAAMPVEPEVRDPFDISDEELELLQRLVERREALQKRADNLDQREALLAATEARISDKMNELKALQALIESLLVQHDEQEEARLGSLVKIYEAMKPKDAARIFEELDMVVLLEVIGRMKERKSAPILAKMNPNRAKAVTLELAQRRELPVAKN